MIKYIYKLNVINKGILKCLNLEIKETYRKRKKQKRIIVKISGI